MRGGRQQLTREGETTASGLGGVSLFRHHDGDPSPSLRWIKLPFVNSSRLQEQEAPPRPAQSSAQPNAPLANRASSSPLRHLWPLTTLAYNSKKETFKKPDFKPRDKGKKFKKKDGEGEDGGYRNRAEERRLGKDSDFAGVEKLLEVSA